MVLRGPRLYVARLAHHAATGPQRVLHANASYLVTGSLRGRVLAGGAADDGPEAGRPPFTRALLHMVTAPYLESACGADASTSPNSNVSTALPRPIPVEPFSTLLVMVLAC